MSKQEPWMQSMENWQKAVSEPFLVYAKSMQVIFVPNPQVQKQISDAWSNMWSMLPQTNLLALPKVEEKKSESYYQMWEKSWETFAKDPFKWYIEFIQKTTEYWMNFWKKE